MKTHLIFLFFIFSLGSCQEDKSPTKTYLYFYNAEIQYETDFQKDVITEALNDMIRLDSIRLKAKRYSNYNQKGDYWTINELVYKYFVPDESSKTLDENFFSELNSSEVRSLLKKFESEIKTIKPE